MVLTRKFLPLLIAVLLFACTDSKGTADNHSEVKEDVEAHIKEESTSLEEFRLVKTDHYDFRRAYHGHHLLEGAERDTFMTRNPESCWDYKDSLNKRYYNLLIKDGFIRDGSLNLSALDTLPDTFKYQVDKLRNVSVTSEYTNYLDTLIQPSYILTFSENENPFLSDTLLYDMPSDVTFYKRDLNRDGKEEIISIYRWYIINGDNYEVDIYELRQPQ
ncbi:hypothetical protein N9Y60_00650 [Crocinitomicaceae bacterium]|nr:hypothetical protein [Crocinitomicaceae bacterium]